MKAHQQAPRLRSQLNRAFTEIMCNGDGLAWGPSHWALSVSRPGPGESHRSHQQFELTVCLRLAFLSTERQGKTQFGARLLLFFSFLGLFPYLTQRGKQFARERTSLRMTTATSSSPLVTPDKRATETH